MLASITLFVAHVLTITTLTTPVRFTAGAPGGASSLVASPNAVYADGNATIVLTVRAIDTKGNPVPAASAALSASGSSNVFGSANLTTDANGRATTTLRSTQVQTETITATFDPNLAVTTSATFSVGPVSAANSSVTIVPASQTADGSSPIAVNITLRDTQNRPMPGVIVTQPPPSA
jgi:adhesin/invasin